MADYPRIFIRYFSSSLIHIHDSIFCHRYSIFLGKNLNVQYFFLSVRQWSTLIAPPSTLRLDSKDICWKISKINFNV